MSSTAIIPPPRPFRLAFVCGGARSGKSRLAQQWAATFPPPRLYLATAQAGDAEMAARIARHRQERGPEWQTVEEPLQLPAALREGDGRFGVILVDCLTLWLANLLGEYGLELDLDPWQEELQQTLGSLRTPVILVSNEVGWGIVPDNPLARRFRDLAGTLHQALAAQADLAVLVVCGLPLYLKP